ncbi:MAG: 50S ribosomal protein L18a [Euryarchaeota archaeon]|nr:50S ribosomal protein L18a [Euryarchaeota archaeon]
MKAFLVRGTFRMGPAWQKFAKEVPAEDAEAAVERMVSELGSKHRVRRNYVRIKDVTPIPVDLVQDPVVRFRLGGSP